MSDEVVVSRGDVDDASPASASHAHALLGLSVIIPAFNETGRLTPTVERTVAMLRTFTLRSELIVADDGSRDGTSELVNALAAKHEGVRLVRLPENRGKGAAVRAGYEASRGQRILFMDADGATDIEAIPRFVRALDDGADVAIASRHHPRSHLPQLQPLHRRVLGRGFRHIVKALSGLSLDDTQCGFKMFSRRAADLLFPRQRLDGFAFDVELCYLAERLGLSLVVLPVVWRDVGQSRVRMPRDPLLMLRDVVRIRWFDWRGRYL